MDEPRVRVFGMGVDGKGPPTAVLRHQGIWLELRFAPGDKLAEGDVEEIRLKADPDTDEQLTARILRRFAPNAELYLAHARSAMRLLGPEDDPQTKNLRLRDSAEALRAISGPGRGIPDAFYRRIAATYTALVADGEPHPIKAIGKINDVTISGASRWVKEARRRGYLPTIAAGKALTLDLDQLDIPTKTLHVLRRVGLQTFGDLAAKSRADLEQIPNFSKRAIKQLETAFAERGYSLRD